MTPTAAQPAILANPTAPAAHWSGVSRVYPARRRQPERVALNNVTLEVPPGQFLALLGPNGSGKSTLLKLLAGTDRPDAGDVALLGADPAAGASASARARLGVVFQHPGLDPLLTIAENLRTAAALFGMTGAQAQAAIERTAAELELTDRLHDRVASLSGGLARRADLARAMLSGPDVLLLDEPSTGLDHAARASFMDLVARLHADAPPERPRTVILSTHLMDEAERAQRVVCMSEGRVALDGEPRALRERLGERTVRVHADGAPDAFARLGLTPQRAGGAWTAPLPDAEGASELAASLAREGFAFELGPATLADVYLHATGQPLNPETEPEAPTPAPLRKRGER
ncbi:MAG: ABC transporter ATP-binding protein [Phycisphaerales bacterium]|nr:MAG: ABC transporter ATP-binding protein [Phycisphaerales bacterium]